MKGHLIVDSSISAELVTPEVRERFDRIRGKGGGIDAHVPLEHAISTILRKISEELDIEINEIELMWLTNLLKNFLRIDPDSPSPLVPLDKDTCMTELVYKSSNLTDKRSKGREMLNIGNTSLMMAGGMGYKRAYANQLSSTPQAFYMAGAAHAYKTAGLCLSNDFIYNLSGRVYTYAEFVTMMRLLCIQGDYRVAWEFLEHRQRLRQTGALN